MSIVFYLLLICFSIVVYIIPLTLIFKRRYYSVISIRSPTLLLINNIGGLLMIMSYITYEMLEETNANNTPSDEFYLFCKIFPNNYLIFHFLMIFSFILRCHRIIQCCGINYDERTDIEEFYRKRHLYKESFYIKILFAVIVIITFLTLLLNLAFDNLMIIPYHFKQCLAPDAASNYLPLIWVLINFSEHIVLVTYTYFISINTIKHTVRLELFAFLLTWIIYPNTIRLIEIVIDDTPHWTSYLSVIFLYTCLVINGYMPIYITFKDKESISYHFNPKLANNMYIYLSNEDCYIAFAEYLRGTHNNDESLFYLNFYTAILKYKLLQTMEVSHDRLSDEAKGIYSKYFSTNTYEQYLDSVILNKVRNMCNQYLKNNDFDYQVYDEALAYAFEYLNKIFKKFTKSEDYQLLIDNLNLNSYIHCKMCNTGLINKF
jgi:hypothetical protein